MTMNQRNTIDLEQGWDFMQKGITKLKNILEGLPEPQFSSEDYMMLYTYYSAFCILISFLNFLCFSQVFSSSLDSTLQDNLQHVHSETPT